MEGRITRLEEQTKTLFKDITELKEKDIFDLRNDVRCIKDKLLGRPTWGVLVTISALLSLSTSLIVILLKR